MDVNRVAFLIRNDDDIVEGVRSATGLGVENYRFAVFIIGASVPSFSSSEAFSELLEMVDDLEGEIFTDSDANAAHWPCMTSMTDETMAARLADFELIIPFGRPPDIGKQGVSRRRSPKRKNDPADRLLASALKNRILFSSHFSGSEPDYDSLIATILKTESDVIWYSQTLFPFPE